MLDARARPHSAGPEHAAHARLRRARAGAERPTEMDAVGEKNPEVDATWRPRGGQIGNSGPHPLDRVGEVAAGGVALDHGHGPSLNWIWTEIVHVLLVGGSISVSVNGPESVANGEQL